MSLKKVIACIRRNKAFLITSHTNMEGDALGSELAFYQLLKKLNKSAVIVNEDNLPPEYIFLPRKEKIIKYRDNLTPVRFDCFVTLDCSDLSRTGEVYRLNRVKKPILNIDHHISNNNFGGVNWVEPKASSCSEMVYKLYQAMRVPLDVHSATALYTGIVADTGSFRYSNTSAFTHKAVSKLLKFKLDIPGIYKHIYEDIPYEDMKLLSKILPGMRREAEGKLIWFEVRQKMLRKTFSFDISEYILSFGRAIKGAEVVVLFKENLGVKDEIRMNFRSQGKVDVNKIAQCFGGGGHKTASGATTHGRIDDVRRKVLAKIRENLKGTVPADS
ncbi:MAG: bifunctional oligoribonuclease/PAP phosphatase NrnA [Candidatus Omnitrophica bacterium]|nr:bifunctional oligoribonuclease/PAP phosphatase NrnA [Candidatus Omnitrophota bacterium]MDD5592318.1 bifunctional oligoribonuclease/PAP phosphatase NrnA [Candidatus Omnitrophota bacterium]